METPSKEQQVMIDSFFQAKRRCIYSTFNQPSLASKLVAIVCDEAV